MLRRGLRHDRVGGCRKVKSEGKKWREECVFTYATIGMADEAGSSAMPDGAGGHRAAKPDGVVHRYDVNLLH
jgi:hypothetical protein